MIFLTLSFLLYFAPALLATSRRNPNATAIWLTNFFVGWTIIGWIITLLWTLSTPALPPLVVAVPAGGNGYPAQPQAVPPAWSGVYTGAQTVGQTVTAHTDPLATGSLRTCVACNRPMPPEARFCPTCGSVESRLG